MKELHRKKQTRLIDSNNKLFVPPFLGGLHIQRRVDLKHNKQNGKTNNESKTKSNPRNNLDGSSLEVVIQMNYKAKCKICKKETPHSICHISRRTGIKLRCNVCLNPQARYLGKKKLEEFIE